jgi:hypothetical protein
MTKQKRKNIRAWRRLYKGNGSKTMPIRLCCYIGHQYKMPGGRAFYERMFALKNYLKK